MTVLMTKRLFLFKLSSTFFANYVARRISFVALTFILLSAISFHQLSAQKTWVGGTDNNWSTADNWDPAVVPTSTDAVTVAFAASNTINVDIAAECASLDLDGIGSTTSLVIQDGQSLTVSGPVMITQPSNDNNTNTLAVNAGTLSCNSLTLNSTLNMNRVISLAITTGTVTVSGNLIMLGAAGENVIDFQGNGTLNIGLLFTALGNGTVNPGTGTINYNGSVAQVVRAGTYNNLTLSGSGTKTTTGATVTGTLSLQGTATPIGTSPTYAAGATLEYAGSAAQTTSNVEFNSAGVPTNLTLNNANGVTLHAARSISGTLSLTAGNLITSAANLLTLAAGASVSGGSKDSFIDGPLAKTGTTAFEFPTGASGIYAPISISAPGTGTDVFTAEYFRTGAPNATNISMGSGIDHVSAIEYWQLDRTGSSSVTVELSWRANSNVTDPGTIVVARFDGTNWTSEGNASNMGDSAGGSVTSNSVTDFSPFTLASTSGGASNPLPVELLSFTAQKKSKGVLLEWETATEVNNAFFQVERSRNGKEFDVISKVEGVGNSDITQSYQWLDENPRSGINYYRLKQVDFDGAFEYHPIVSVDMGPIKEASLQLFPNPSIDKVTVILPSEVEGEADLVIYNALGQLVKTTTIDLVKGNNNTELDIRDLAKGRYTMVVNYGGQRLTQAPLMIQK